MNKKTFIKTLERLRQLQEFTEGVDSAMKKLSPDFGGFCLNVYEDLIMDLLKEIMNDGEEWIGYFIYERNWKFTNRKIITDKNGKNLPLRNYDDLWNLITRKD